MATITRTFTLPEDVYKKFKRNVSGREMSKTIASLMKRFTAREAFRELVAMKMTRPEFNKFSSKMKLADRAALKAVR